jgi:hypothetical protein
MASENFNINVMLNSSGVAAGARKITGMLNSSLISPLKGMLAGLVGVSAIVTGAKNIMDFAGRIQDLSDKLGVGTSDLQAFAYAAEMTGSNLEDVATALKRIALSKTTALAGNVEDLAAYGRFKIGKSQLAGMSSGQILSTVLDQMKGVGASSQQMADTINLLGRSADTLIPAAREGFTDLTESAVKLGYVIDEGTIKKLDDTGDAIAQLGWKIRTDLAPALVTMVNAAMLAGRLFQGSFGATGKWLIEMTKGKSPKDAKAIADKYAEDALLPIFYQEENKKPAPYSHEPLVIPEVKKTQKENALEAGYTMPSVDALARIGLFVGAASSGRNVQKQQLSKLSSIDSKMDGVVKALNIAI